MGAVYVGWSGAERSRVDQMRSIAGRQQVSAMRIVSLERSLQEWDLPVKRFRVDGISYESFQFRHAGSFLGVFLPFRHRSGQLRAVNITIRKRVAKRSRLWAMILVFPAVLLALANASSSKAEDVF